MKRLIFTITLLILSSSVFALDEARMIIERAKDWAEITEKIERLIEKETEWFSHPEMQEYLDFIAKEKESQAKLYRFLEKGEWE